MVRITASEVRRNWFQILDRVAAGEVVTIERNGLRLVLRREEEQDPVDGLPDYSRSIRPISNVERADQWSWDWTEEGELRPGDDAAE